VDVVAEWLECMVAGMADLRLGCHSIAGNA
jgi:hypothetical protein